MAAQKSAAEVVSKLLLSMMYAQNSRNSQDYAAEFYGTLPLHQSQSRPHRPRVDIASLPSRDGETVLLRARIHNSRAQGSKMVFLNLRQRIESVQALMIVAPEKVSKQMLKWAAGLATESIVLVEGVVKKSPEIIKSATVGTVEVEVSKVRIQIISMLAEILIFM